MKTIRVSYPSSRNPFSARAVILPNAYANVIFLFVEQDDVHVTQRRGTNRIRQSNPPSGRSVFLMH